jgi:FkbM family methyltransferase
LKRVVSKRRDVTVLKKVLDEIYRATQDFRKPSKASFDGVDSEGTYFVRDEDTGDKVFVSHPRRLGYYKNGIKARIDNLAYEYCVSNFTLTPQDIVVDVGAHSGEFGLWATRYTANYLGIDPDPQAFRALRKNFPLSKLENLAIGAEAGQARLSLATSTGDSSFHLTGRHPSVTVEVATLDQIIEKHFSSAPIALIKVEAEGHEPEVLNSGKSALARTSWVTLDAGEERGGVSTAPDCLNFLYSLGFTLEKVFLRRGIFLLRGPCASQTKH